MRFRHRGSTRVAGTAGSPPAPATNRSRIMKWSLGSLGLFSILAQLHGAETYRVSDASGFNRAVAAAKPGDTILVAAGDYAGNFHFRGLQGTALKPIVIAAADPCKPPTFVGNRAPLHFSSVTHLELKDL